MLMSNSYTLRQVAKDLETLLTKKRETQTHPQVKPTETSHPAAGKSPEQDQDAS